MTQHAITISGVEQSARKGRRAAPPPPEDPATMLHWNSWPTPDMPLKIVDQEGTWSFRGPFPCGPQEYVLLTEFARRDVPGGEVHVVAIANVRQPATNAKQSGRGSQSTHHSPAQVAPEPTQKTRKKPRR